MLGQVASVVTAFSGVVQEIVAEGCGVVRFLGFVVLDQDGK